MKSGQYRVLTSRKTDYPEPIILKKGDIGETGKEYTGKEPWRGWIWCEKNGEKGWVPHQMLEKIEERQAKVLEDYNGTELTAVFTSYPADRSRHFRIASACFG